MCDLIKQLDIKAGVMETGEKIPWGSDTALMREAAYVIEEQMNAMREAADIIRELCQTFDIPLPEETLERLDKQR